MQWIVDSMAVENVGSSDHLSIDLLRYTAFVAQAQTKTVKAQIYPPLKIL